MTLSEYEEFVNKRWGGKDRLYAALGFGGEAGEVLNEIKKEIRTGLPRREEVALEIGDALFYLVRLSSFYGFSLHEIMDMNVEKLEKRDENNYKV